jgi:TolB protein
MSVGRTLLHCWVLALLALGACTAEPQVVEPANVPTPSATPIRTEQLPGKLALGRAGAIWVWQDRQLRQIIPPPATQPAFAPDGLSLAYIARSPGATDLLVADGEGNRLGRLTDHGSSLPPTSLDRVYETAWAFYPSWSPTGDRLLVAMQARPPAGDPPRDPPLGLVEVGLYGGFQPLTDGDGLDYGRSVMAESNIIYAVGVSRDRDAVQTIYAIEPNGARNMLSGIPGPAYDPVLSRDQRYLLFAATVDGRTDIYGLDLLSGGATAVRLTDFGTARAPAVSPDGTLLAFLAIAPDGATFDLFVADFSLDANGALRADRPRRLSTELGFDPDAGLSWAP